MKLKGVHFLLTYKCTMECDHCFVYSGPFAEGTFTLDRVREALDESRRIGTIEWIYFEGGEAFMFYPVMLEGIRLAKSMGFRTGVVTNSYWAVSEDDAELWLKPLRDLGLEDLSLSEDAFHFGDDRDTPAKRALKAAEKLGMPAGRICIEKPSSGSGCLLKGRAAEKLIEDLELKPCQEFAECEDEDLAQPERVHVDPYGYVHLCQGLVMGNTQDERLSELVKSYDPASHPVCGPLLQGGPKLLAEKYGIRPLEKYASACHFCYLVRKELIDRFPQYLAPRQVYGLE